ncbi:heme biosynthesis protein HemY [Psychromonas sp. MB-3u-54]|uniref:heme biosynthesis HemY N-terminal domain-containing protein n=1 Tax=Psychromonas sp. MB-3u-54 TaxID=2058319 RepID=UPI000C323DCB|nr:heme biosynthesis HemY N-terminal domain-containing protein [Psychromonas sp. MB-3u-54]PKH02204.1 heme biosynthesis protein HemY [Psychromonas sp. MB-3u-54]
MIRIIIVIAALIAGLFFGPEISTNKGYILISLDTYTTYETTIINALIATVVFYFLLGLIEWVLRKLLSMSSLTRGWFGQRKTKKAQKNSLLGMLALLEGNSKQAQKLLSKSAEKTAAPALNYIAAAQAAQQQNDYALRDSYLQQATKSQKGCSLAVGLVWVELQIEAKQFVDAQLKLKELDSTFPGNKRIAKLYLDIYPALNQWADYIDLLIKQRKYLSLVDTEFEAIKLNAYQHLFKQLALQSGEALQALWNDKSSRSMRKDIAYQSAMLDAFIEAERYEFAEHFLVEKLKEQFNLPLLAYVDKIQITDNNKLILILEKQLKKDSENGAIHHALAKLKLNENNESAAIEYLQKGLELDPNVDDFALLANILEKADRMDEANNYYRKGLLLFMSSK